MNLESLYSALDILVKVLIWSLYIAIPIIILITVVYLWDTVKKKRDKETRKQERIIVKNNEEINKTAQTVNVLQREEKDLKASVFDLEARKKQLSIELGEEVSEVVEEEQEEVKVDYSTWTVRELQDKFKELGLKGYSRWSKDKLIRKLLERDLSDVDKPTTEEQ